jgi:hypothetical protein
MILGEKKPAGKKRTIKSVTDDLLNGAWNNLDLSKSSKQALTNAGLIVLFGGAAASYIILRKK